MMKRKHLTKTNGALSLQTRGSEHVVLRLPCYNDTEIKCHAKYLYAKRTEYLIQENDKVSLLYFH